MLHGRTTKNITVMIVIVLVTRAVIITMDYRRVCHGFEKPIFAISRTTANDGGSGIYRGLGYSFEIKGYFMPGDELPGVIHADFYLLGRHVKEATRD